MFIPGGWLGWKASGLGRSLGRELGGGEGVELGARGMRAGSWACLRDTYPPTMPSTGRSSKMLSEHQMAE